jgi:hypothetical protein
MGGVPDKSDHSDDVSGPKGTTRSGGSLGDLAKESSTSEMAEGTGISAPEGTNSSEERENQ